MDPGLSGGIAIILVDDSVVHLQTVYVWPMPMAGKDLDLTALSRLIGKSDYPTIAVVENVHAMPGQGVTSMFKFGFVTGAVHGVLATLGIPRYLATPQAWKKVILAGTAKDKASASDWCSRTYPNVSLLESPRCHKPHSGMSDALAIAHFCIVTYG